MRACSCDISKINQKKELEAKRILNILEEKRIQNELDKLFHKVNKERADNLEKNKENQRR